MAGQATRRARPSRWRRSAPAGPFDTRPSRQGRSRTTPVRGRAQEGGKECQWKARASRRSTKGRGGAGDGDVIGTYDQVLEVCDGLGEALLRVGDHLGRVGVHPFLSQQVTQKVSAGTYARGGGRFVPSRPSGLGRAPNLRPGGPRTRPRRRLPSTAPAGAAQQPPSCTTTLP